MLCYIDCPERGFRACVPHAPLSPTPPIRRTRINENDNAVFLEATASGKFYLFNNGNIEWVKNRCDVEPKAATPTIKNRA